MKDLRRRGFEVIALAPNLSDEHAMLLGREGIASSTYPLSPTGLNPVLDMRNMFALRRVLMAVRPDIVLTNTIKPVIFGTFAALLASVPKRCALVSGLGYAFTDDGGATGMRKRLIKGITSILYGLAFRSNEVVIFQNRDDVKEMVDSGICPAGRARCVSGSGVDISLYPFMQRTLNPPVFIMVARLLAEKGVRNYLEAARLVKAAVPEVRFLLVGDIDKNPSSLSSDEVGEYVSDEIVEWVGHVHHVKEYLAQASVFVLPSYREGIPRSTLEAMSAGLAIITTDVPGCRETVRDEKNGLLVPVRDTPALVAAMYRFIQDPNLAAKMGKVSRRIVEDVFEVSKVNEEMCMHMGLNEMSLTGDHS
jgi:glycosyltransferase involved in cell wall biosynthesis